jgi:plastocyanin
VTIRSIVAGALCALAVVAAGARAEAVARKPVTHTVTIESARFSPAELTVHPGDTVVWVNKDILAHTATSQKGAFDSKTIQPGASWRYQVKAKTTGEFPYTCSFHPMNAVLRVK